MLPMKVTRPDPAPSRIKYRLERLWLRPMVQRMVRVYLPALFVGVGIAVVATHPRVLATATEFIQTVQTELSARPELMVVGYEVEGASSALEERIAAELQLQLPVSALQLDLGKMQQNVRGLDPVDTARLRINEHGLLTVVVTERIPSAIWRNADGLFLVDATGARVDRLADRSTRKDLPLVAGLGADAVIDEALRLLVVAGPISKRVRGLVRIGERRWDVVLDEGLVVRLPEQEPDAALARVLALQYAEEILDRDVVVVDMRDPRRPLLRLNDPALETLRRPVLINPEGEDV